MTALNLGDASRVLAPPSAAFSMVAFGDVDLIPADDPHPVDMWGEWPRIPRATSAGASMLTSDAAITPSEHFAAFVAVTGPTVGGGSWDVFASPPFALGLKPSVLAWARAHGWNIADNDALSEATDAGVTVFAITNGATASRAANSRQGTIVTETPFTGAYSNSVYVYPASEDDPNAGILGIWYFDDVDVSETDMLDTIGAIEAMFAAPPGAIHASVELEFGAEFQVGVGTVNASNEPPEDPELESGGAVVPPEAPEPATPSELAPFGIEPVRHVWERMGAPTLDEWMNPETWTPEAEGHEEWGTFQFVFEGTDVTVINGAQTPLPTWSEAEPFGPQSATFVFPQFTAFHAMPSWAKPGANVSIRRRRMDGTVDSRWEGIVISVGDRRNKTRLTLSCAGLLLAHDYRLRPPTNETAPKDIGVLIAKLMNAVPGQRYAAATSVVTGIQSSVSGGWEPLFTGYIQKILSTAVKNGKQWTVKCVDRTPVIALKDTSTIAWEVRSGQRGVEIDLNLDATEAHNVIFGEGVNSRGGSWRNMVYPGWTGAKTVPFPFSDASKRIRLGTKDSDTDSGDGVSTLQRKIGRKATGTMSRADVNEVIRRQRKAGILDDGIVGPQTWAAFFRVGANSGTLKGAYPLPLAAASKVLPRLIGPDGTDLGPNPDYDPSIFRSETRLSYGQGVSRARAIHDAEQRLKRNGTPGYAGTISFVSDPESKSRFELEAGENGMILDHRGQDLKVHVARVEHNAARTTLQVDTQNRDYPELQALIARDRDAVDPARVKRLEMLAGKVSTDYPTYDAESPGGRIERHAVVGGLWTIAVVSIGAFGSVYRTSLRTFSGARAFSWVAFSRPITANQLDAWIGNPLTATENPFESESLGSHGFLYGVGWKDQPGGYWPHSYWNHKGTTGKPVTGRVIDDMPWEYATSDGEHLYVATMAADDCFIEGRLYGMGAEVDD